MSVALEKPVLNCETGNSCDPSDRASSFQYRKRSTENEP